MEQAVQARREQSAPQHPIPTVDQLSSLLELIAAEAAAGDALGRLTDRTVEALNAQRLFDLWVPRSFGGLDAGILDSLRIFEKLCEADGSTGWVVMAAGVAVGSAAAYLPEAGARAVFDGRIPVIAGQGAPRGRADVDGDGYRLSGKWSYGSGLLHAEYIHTGAIVHQDGKPVEARTFILPLAQAQVLGNWDVVGLRATGSVDYTIDNVYVPREFTHSPNALVPLRDSEIGHIGIVGMSPIGHGSFALGIGRRILDELRALANAPGGRPTAMTDGTGENLQEGYGIAEGKLRAGRAFFYEACADMEATLRKGDPIATRQFTLLRLALNHVTTAVADVSSFAYRVAGGVALRQGTLQRCVRDVMAGTQHRIVSPYMLRECAKELLGQAKGKVWATPGLIDRPAQWPV